MCSCLNILINDTADLLTLNTQLTALKVMPERSLPDSEINNKGHKNEKSDKKYTTEPNMFTAREQNKKAGCCLAPLQLSVSGGDSKLLLLCIHQWMIEKASYLQILRLQTDFNM